jgi:hypothetical protein
MWWPQDMVEWRFMGMASLIDGSLSDAAAMSVIRNYGNEDIKRQICNFLYGWLQDQTRNDVGSMERLAVWDCLNAFPESVRK